MKILLIANDCNPEWPSLPVVGYKFAKSLDKLCDITLATHIRNKENIEKLNEFKGNVHYIDNEYIARPMFKLSTWLRGGNQVAWSTNMMMAYLPYIEFERQIYKCFKNRLKAGEFDIVHRVTPMSPTLPSFLSGRIKQPFVIGPLNGNLSWPKTFENEQKREKELLRKLRNFHKFLPYSRTTFSRSTCILAAFQHTIDDIPKKLHEKVVPLPEIGFDKSIFYPAPEKEALKGNGPFTFLYAGRLVPYKVPEAIVRAFATSDSLKKHRLVIVGEGPEKPRLEQIVKENKASASITFEGQKTQQEVAQYMRQADIFVFPSIRELGAGVVIEAMATGMVCIVTDYGAPGDLAANDRGILVPLTPLEQLVEGYRGAMENCVNNPAEYAELGVRAKKYASELYTWDAKAKYTMDIFNAIINKKDLGGFKHYL